MSKSIPLSPKHGVNPTLGICLFCGEPTGELGLVGRLKGDAEAPMYSVLSYEPCDKCKANMARGVTLLGYSDKPRFPNMPTIKKGENTYPTGSYIVITEEGANAMFQNAHFVTGQKAWVPQSLIEDIIKNQSPDA